MLCGCAVEIPNQTKKPQIKKRENSRSTLFLSLPSLFLLVLYHSGCFSCIAEREKMGTAITDSEFAVEHESNPLLEEQCWHLLSLLLQIGEPTDPEHLSSRCRLFNASPCFVRYVASLPASPLSVNRDGLLIPSANALFALARFFWDPPHSPFRKRKLFFSSTECKRDFDFWFFCCS